LPAGWDVGHPDAARTSPAGVGADPDFIAAGDTTRYIVAAPAAGGPYKISVELLYQPLAPRFAAELFAVDTPEVRAFEALYETADTHRGARRRRADRRTEAQERYGPHIGDESRSTSACSAAICFCCNCRVAIARLA
jgi:hypothetical protein